MQNKKVGIMWEKEEFFKGVSFIKIAFLILFFFGAMVMVSQVRGEDNKTISEPDFRFAYPKIIEDNKWSSQLIYDTIGACYQGTIKWILLSNPVLLGQMPGPMAQRQMVEHCFCVVDKVRKDQPVEKYRKNIFDQEFIGNLFLTKASECIKEYKTLPSFFTAKSDNETIIDNTTIPKEEPKEDSKESSPDQNKEESIGDSETIFQG